MKFVAACVLGLGLAFSTQASAQLLLPAGGSPEQEEPAVDEGAVIVEEAPPEQQELRGSPPPVEEPASRSWLRQDGPGAKSATPEGSGSGNGLSAVALLLVLGLAGGAAFLHFRRGNSKTVRAASSMRVLSSVRIGPKANLVTVLVSDRVMILGVTESNIVELGSVASDLGEVSQEEEEPTNPARPARMAAANREPFERVLAGSTARMPFQGNPGVASLLAAQTEDVVVHTRKTTTRKRGRAESANDDNAPPRVEDQAAGLLRRRS